MDFSRIPLEIFENHIAPGLSIKDLENLKKTNKQFGPIVSKIIHKRKRKEDEEKAILIEMYLKNTSLRWFVSFYQDYIRRYPVIKKFLKYYIDFIELLRYEYNIKLKLYDIVDESNQRMLELYRLAIQNSLFRLNLDELNEYLEVMDLYIEDALNEKDESFF